MNTLYDRLHELREPGIKDNLVKAVLSPIVPPREYFSNERIFQKNRDELSFLIYSYLNERGAKLSMDMNNKIYYSFSPKRGLAYTKKPLLSILYGRIGCDRIPDKVFNKLEDWEAVYFLPGVWSGMSAGFIGDKYTATKLNAWSIEETVARTIKSGVEKMKKYKGVLGKELPHKEEIIKACDEAIYLSKKVSPKKKKSSTQDTYLF